MLRNRAKRTPPVTAKKLGLTGSSIKSVDELVDPAVGGFDLTLKAGFSLCVVRG